MAFQEDLSVFMQDFGIDVVFSAVTYKALLDQPTEEILSGLAQSDEYQMTFVATDFPNLARNSTVTINAENYTVREEPITLDDGGFKSARLSKQ